MSEALERLGSRMGQRFAPWSRAVPTCSCSFSSSGFLEVVERIRESRER